MNDKHKGSRLPPPVFPPGARRRARPPSATPEPEGPRAVSGADDGFISPDDPIPERRDAVQKAFISPDDPMSERHDELSAAYISPDEPMPVRSEDHEFGGEWIEQGIVTSLGDDPHLEPHELVSGGDPHVLQLRDAVSRLVEALNTRGEGGLRATADMSRFEATLRAYCVGYLAGRRAEEDPPPAFDPFPEY